MTSLSQFRVETSAICAAFVASSSWWLSWHDWSEVLRLDGESVIPPAYGQHFTTFCMAVKNDGGNRNGECKRCDLVEARAACVADPQVAVRRCHAGADEVQVPVHHRGTFVGIAYLGQFRSEKAQPAALALLDAQGVARVLALGRLVQGWLNDLCHRVEAAKFGAGDDRSKRIRAYLEATPNGDLPGLASDLGLSVTRAGHVVRECTGRPFTVLRDELRLERAKHFLLVGNHSIAAIATEVGFTDANYFTRCFRQRYGMTPGDWRRQRVARNDV